MSRTISVVIASGAGGEFLFRCLDSLEGPARNEAEEVIVVDRAGDEIRERLRTEYGWVTLLEADLAARPSVPELRRAGARAASGEIVAVIEEHCVAPDHWLDAITSSFENIAPLLLTFMPKIHLLLLVYRSH